MCNSWLYMCAMHVWYDGQVLGRFMVASYLLMAWPKQRYQSVRPFQTKMVVKDCNHGDAPAMKIRRWTLQVDNLNPVEKHTPLQAAFPRRELRVESVLHIVSLIQPMVRGLWAVLHLVLWPTIAGRNCVGFSQQHCADPGKRCETAGCHGL